MTRKRVELTREAWLEAGQALLRDEGLRALRLRPLADALSISTGSFYHHFRDFDAFLEQLADYFGGEQVTTNLAAIRERAASPADRIRIAAEVAHVQELPRLAAAMRAWARSDARAQRAVETVDQTLLAFFSESLEAMGHTPRDALIRAFLLVSSATTDMAPPPALGTDYAGLSADMLAIICGLPAKP